MKLYYTVAAQTDVGIEKRVNQDSLTDRKSTRLNSSHIH